MSNKVKIESLQKQLDNILNNYKEGIDEAVERETDEKINLAKAELKATSPAAEKVVSIGVGKTQAPGTYKNSWYVAGKKNANLYTKVIANRVYQLTHLLEFGHTLRNGKPWKGIPHIRKVEDEYQEKFVEGLIQDIEKM